MAPSLTRKDGVPVLAYLASDTASPKSCSLFVKFSEHDKKVGISLRFLIDIHGFDVVQKFTLIYNADNLVPGKCSLLDAVNLPFDPQGVTRQGTPRLKILSLQLKKPCPVLCPPSGSILPKHGVESPFQQLAKLAEATKIEVVFDYNWIERNNQRLFQCVISKPQDWNNYSTKNSTNRLGRQADWLVFGPAASALSEAPPSYTDTPDIRLKDCVNKPRRRAASSSPSRSDPKRLRPSLAPLQVPTASPEFTCPHTPTYAPLPAYPLSSTYAPSPTEKYTPAGTPSPISRYSPAIYTPIHAAPSPTEKDTSVGTPSPWSQHHSEKRVPDFAEVVSDAVEAVLPRVLNSILPDILSQIFAVPPSSPSLSPASSQIRKSTPTSAPISSLRTLLRPQIAAHAEAQLRRVYDEVLDLARDMRTTADEDFFKFVEEERTKISDFVEEEKTIITVLADDCISNLNKASDERTDEFENDTAGILQGTEKQFERVSGNVSDMVNTMDMLEEKMACLRREMESFVKTRATFEEQRSKEQTVAEGQSRRAVSLPV